MINIKACIFYLDNILACKYRKESSEFEKNLFKKKYHFKNFITKINKDDIFKIIKNFLNELRDNDIKIVLTSSNINIATILNTSNLINIFDAIIFVIDEFDIYKQQTRAEILLNIAEKINLPPEFCIVFEDSRIGVQSAKKANMKCIGIGLKKILKEADAVITNVDDLNFSNIESIMKNAKEKNNFDNFSF